jgi:hypothetical protein
MNTICLSFMDQDYSCTNTLTTVYCLAYLLDAKQHRSVALRLYHRAVEGYLTGVYLAGVCLMGMHLMGIHLIGGTANRSKAI